MKVRGITKALLIAPGLGVAVVPSLMLPLMSLHRGRFVSFPWSGWSTEWYSAAFRDSRLQGTIGESLMIAASTAIICTALGAPAAYALARRMRSIAMWASLLSLPAFIPFLIYGYSMLVFASAAGFARTPAAVVAGHLAVFGPVVISIVTYRCLQLNEELEQAAREFGVSELGVAWSVVVPQVRSTIFAAMLIVFVLSWDEFVISWFVSGFDKTYPVRLKEMLESTTSPEISAIGVIVGAVSLGLATAALKLAGFERRNTEGRTS